MEHLLVVLIAVAFVIGILIGQWGEFDRGKTEAYKEMVPKGYAKFVVNDKGEVHLEWLPPCKEN